jgi:hypothetical protein
MNSVLQKLIISARLASYYPYSSDDCPELAKWIAIFVLHFYLFWYGMWSAMLATVFPVGIHYMQCIFYTTS